MMFWPIDPLTNVSIVVKNQEVSPGGRQCFTVTGIKTVNAPADVIVEMMNGELIPIMSFHSNEPAGPINLSRCFNVPYQVETDNSRRDKYSIRLIARYYVNTLREITEVEKSDCFYVIDREGKKLRDAIIEQDRLIKKNTDDIGKLKGR